MTKDLACRQLLRVAVDGFETKLSILLVNKVQSMQKWLLPVPQARRETVRHEQSCFAGPRQTSSHSLEAADDCMAYHGGCWSACQLVKKSVSPPIAARSAENCCSRSRSNISPLIASAMWVLEYNAVVWRSLARTHMLVPVSPTSVLICASPPIPAPLPFPVPMPTVPTPGKSSIPVFSVPVNGQLIGMPKPREARSSTVLLEPRF